MSLIRVVQTRNRGAYDGIAHYRLFDEVLWTDSKRYVLIAPSIAGVSPLCPDYWQPLTSFEDAKLPYQGDGTDAEVNALLAKLKAGGLMVEDAPTLAVSFLSPDQDVEVDATPDPLECMILSSDGRDVAYQWYSNAADANTGGTPISGADEPELVLAAPTEAGTTYYYCVGSLEGVTKASEPIAVVAAVAEGG